MKLIFQAQLSSNWQKGETHVEAISQVGVDGKEKGEDQKTNGNETVSKDFKRLELKDGMAKDRKEWGERGNRDGQWR